MNSTNWFEQVHLSWTDDPSSTLTLTWFTPGGEDSEVLYRPSGADTWQSEPMIWVPVDETRTLSRASLRGLQPCTTYEYQLVIREGKELTDKRSPIWTTRTAPAGAADFTFGFLADTGLIGRLDGNATGTAQVLREIGLGSKVCGIGCALATKGLRSHSVGVSNQQERPRSPCILSHERRRLSNRFVVWPSVGISTGASVRHVRAATSTAMVPTRDILVCWRGARSWPYSATSVRIVKPLTPNSTPIYFPAAGMRVAYDDTPSISTCTRAVRCGE